MARPRLQGCRNSMPNIQRKFWRVRRGGQASQRKGLTSGEVRELPGKSGQLPGKFGGNFRGTLTGLLLSSTVGELPGKSPKNFRGSSGSFPGEVRGLPRSSGEPDSLPATRQICLQNIQERKISPKKKFWGPDILGVIRADIPAQNFGQGGQNPGKTQAFRHGHLHDPKARTSTTLSDFQKLQSEKLRAEFSFPQYDWTTGYWTMEMNG